MRHMTADQNSPEQGAVLEPLTGTELRILKLLDLGLSNQEIAVRLGITVGTTKWHLHHLFEKLRVPSRAKATALARERGLV
jgi:LuxR family maltose regulon positive regulatory protein